MVFYDIDVGILGVIIVNGSFYNLFELLFNFNIEVVVFGLSVSSVVFIDVSGNMVGDYMENIVLYWYKLNDILFGLGVGIYIFKVEVFIDNNGGGVFCDEVILIFIIVCDLVVNVGNDEEICEGESVILIVFVFNGVGSVFYLWNIGVMSVSIIVSFGSIIIYMVSVFDDWGC